MMWGGPTLCCRATQIREFRLHPVLEKEHVGRLDVLVRYTDPVKLGQTHCNVMQGPQNPGKIEVVGIGNLCSNVTMREFEYDILHS